MNRPLLALLTLALLAPALAAQPATTPAPAAAAVPLRYQFRKGGNLNYTFQFKSNLTAVVPAAPGGRPRTEVITDVDQTTDSVWTCRDLKADGTAVVAQVNKRVRVVVKTPDGTVQVDTSGTPPADDAGRRQYELHKAGVNKEILVTMTPAGAVTAVKLPADLLTFFKKRPELAKDAELFTEAGYKQFLERSGVVFPDKPLAVGETWDSPTVQLGDGAMTMTMAVKNTLAAVDGPTARIDRAVTLAVRPDPGAPVQIKVKRQSGAATVKFNVPDGVLEDLSAEQAVTTERPVEFEPGKEAQNVEFVMTTKVTMRRKP